MHLGIMTAVLTVVTATVKANRPVPATVMKDQVKDVHSVSECAAGRSSPRCGTAALRAAHNHSPYGDWVPTELWGLCLYWIV
jgi:hypothetical protein